MTPNQRDALTAIHAARGMLGYFRWQESGRTRAGRLLDGRTHDEVPS